MLPKTEDQLLRAKTLFEEKKLVECYNILRRFFDRIPFAFEAGHSEHIGRFGRVLLELGKEYELSFYAREIDRVYQATRNPQVGYALGLIHMSCDKPSSVWISLFEEVSRHENAGIFRDKAKMCLLHSYIAKEDYSSCWTLLKQIQTNGDLEFDILIDIWEAVILRRERKFEPMDKTLATVFARIREPKYWYPYFSARIVQALSFIDRKRDQEARTLLAEIRSIFEAHPFRTVHRQIDSLEKQIRSDKMPKEIYLAHRDEYTEIFTETASIKLRSSNPAEQLLLALFSQQRLSKHQVIQVLYRRNYQSRSDDALIYYHVHHCRNLLESHGLPRELISTFQDGYQLQCKVTQGGPNASL